PAEDVATIFFTVVGGNPNDPDPAKRPGLVFRNGEGPPVQRVYQHPGGMQMVGHMLALANESPKRPTIANPDSTPHDHLPPIPDPNYDVAPHPTAILFFDVSDPEAPVWKSQFAPLDGPEGDPASKPLLGADGLGVTPLPNGLYLMSVKGGFEEADPIYFYRSTSGDLSSPDLKWEFVNRTKVPHVEDSHQTFQFLREGNIHGDLYMAGARGLPVFAETHDRIDLYRLECDTPDCAPGEHTEVITVVHGKRVEPRPDNGGDRLANLAAATGFYVSPSGELIFYATEHDNDGPDETVKAGEWRHHDMVREGSPTLLPTAEVNGPYEVDEGRTVSLTGEAKPPITKAWIQLYDETNFGIGLGTFVTSVDYDDFALDNFDNFFDLEPRFDFTRADTAKSWRYFAPAGCSILAIDHEGGVIDEARTLAGDGAVHQDADLKLVLNDGGTDDIDQEIDAVDFLDDCDRYYATPHLLRWDLDLNGSFETTGSSVTFNALAFDGPSDVAVPVEAQHPSGGPVGLATAKVHVRNVAPQLAQVRVTDSAGRQVGVDVPFVLTRVPVIAGASFGDPGVLDHQTATLAWGDGSVEPQTAFTTFDEAFGDGTGAVSHRHRYTLAGSHPITLSVTDDDGGVGSQSTVVRVVGPQQAVEEIVGLLDGVIAATPDGNALKDLGKARKALFGNPNGKNGALEKIRDGNSQAAIAFLDQAISWLGRAQADGAADARIATLVALLEQVEASLSAA
ncbi:MAG TPA: PKD domain-containing protein, partial [Thermoanaerobaculia bacterium]|nr:PKD domain-containing protein [Thermoanaerobaculia bacterium]